MRFRLILGETYTIDGFRYLPRQDGGVNGRIGQYEFYVSADGVSWGSPVAVGGFVNDAGEKQVSFAPRAGRYVRLRAISEVNGNPWTSMAEINVLGTLPSSSQVISQAGWSLSYKDSEELVGENGAAVNSFDGNVNTVWHTQYKGGSPGCPSHEIQINLGQTYDMKGFRYLPRQDGWANGWIGQYEFYVSADGTNWGSGSPRGLLQRHRKGGFLCAEDRSVYPFEGSDGSQRQSVDGNGGNQCPGQLRSDIPRWWTIKHHYLYLHSFSTGSELRHGLEQWIRFYNYERGHSSLDDRTPDEVYYGLPHPFAEAA